MATATVEPRGQTISIPAPKFEVAEFVIRGTEPYVQLRFDEKAKQEMLGKHIAGSTAGSKKIRKPKNPKELYAAAMYQGKGGWRGFPASVIRNASISACRLVGFKMTLAKLAIFVLADGADTTDGTPMVKITKGKPEMITSVVRNANGAPDVRVRAQWEPGWEATIRIRYDAEIFTRTDIANLLMRVGMQVGIGEGRPDSKNSPGMGWGIFEIKG